MKKIYVYTHHVIDADVWYVGVTSKPKERFQNHRYEKTSLGPYIKDSGVPFKQNKNIETTILYCVNDMKTALSLEDRLIIELNCINKHRSGLISSDKNQYYKEKYRTNPEVYQMKRIEWKKNHQEQVSSYVRKWRKNNLEEVRAKDRIAQAAKRSTPAGKIYNRVDSYNRRNNPIVTPSEAVEMFELTGWVPTFVKHDDLLHVDTVI